MPPETYHIEDNKVGITTQHFTRFIVTSKVGLEINTVLLTLEAKYYSSKKKAFIKLRLMLHSHCATLHDFASERKKV